MVYCCNSILHYTITVLFMYTVYTLQVYYNLSTGAVYNCFCFFALSLLQMLTNLYV